MAIDCLPKSTGRVKQEARELLERAASLSDLAVIRHDTRA